MSPRTASHSSTRRTFVGVSGLSPDRGLFALLADVVLTLEVWIVSLLGHVLVFRFPWIVLSAFGWIVLVVHPVPHL